MIKLKPCPNPLCRSEDVERVSSLYVGCKTCAVYGPDNDPTGEKWNAMLRVDDVQGAVENAFERGVKTGRIQAKSIATNNYTGEPDRRMGE